MNKDRFNEVRTFPEELVGWVQKIEKIASAHGLTYFPVIFEMADWDVIYQIASRGGFLTRYPHWSFGQSYDHMRKQYQFQTMKISEMVINTDPVYAYLMTSNSLVDQKMVIAHVYGHADFFLNNVWFSKTDRKMLNTMGNHATIINSYIDKYGEREVENFLDLALSIEDQIDKHSILIKRKKKEIKSSFLKKDLTEEINDGSQKVELDYESAYMDQFVNPKELMDEQKEAYKKKKEIDDQYDIHLPEKDLLYFLILKAPLKAWQKHILSIIREEGYYFAPQGMTKIMNEGWASYWHSTMMTDPRIMNNAEIVEYAKHHCGTMGSSKALNPYKLGLEIFKDIEDRWNKGKFGKEWEECDDIYEKEKWDKKLGLGKQKIFEVRENYNDVMFIDEFLTKELVEKLNLFSFETETNSEAKIYKISNRQYEEIKNKLLFQLTNHGRPRIEITDYSTDKYGSLILQHKTDHQLTLDQEDTKTIVANIQKLWKKPVKLKSFTGHHKVTYENDGGQTVVKVFDDYDEYSEMD